jgi:Flp pilus assembly protein TadD
MDAEMSDSHGVNEVHPWDPHKAAKDVEVGDYYLKVRKNYRAAEDRYREALYYKENDAMATYGLAVSLEKLNRPEEARQEYKAYLKILPEGSEAKNARKALARLKDSTGNPALDK